jgi:hypothetical protein
VGNLHVDGIIVLKRTLEIFYIKVRSVLFCLKTGANDDFL